MLTRHDRWAMTIFTIVGVVIVLAFILKMQELRSPAAENEQVRNEIPTRSYVVTTTTNTISAEVSAFITFQNQARGQGGIPVDYNALTGTVPAGGNTVTGVAGITSSGTLALGAGYNAVIFDGTNSVQAGATGSPDNYALSVATNGTETIVDENTGNTLAITGDAYLVFNGGAQNSDGSYQSLKIVGSGNFANIALMYDAAFERQPDLPGLEFYAQPAAAGTLSLHQAAVYFLNSPEFVKDYPALSAAPDNGGPNDQAFINELYGNILRRTPTASEVNFYVEALQGTLSGETAPADRALLLTYFAVSSENQKNSTWLINTDNGAYADPGYGIPGSEPASTVFNVSPGGVLNTGLADPSTIQGGVINSQGLFIQLFAGSSAKGIISTENDLTIYMSPAILQVDISNATGETVYTGQTIHNRLIFSDLGGTAYLQANNDTLYGEPSTNGAGATGPSPLIVHGFNSTDSVQFKTGYETTTPTTVIEPTPAQGTTIQGSSLLSSFPYEHIAINVGSVSDNSPAAMAAAAAKIYTPLTPAQAAHQFGENILFFGQGPNNDTVIYYWDADATHQLTAGTMKEGVDLIGVSSSQIAVSNLIP